MSRRNYFSKITLFLGCVYTFEPHCILFNDCRGAQKLRCGSFPARNVHGANPFFRYLANIFTVPYFFLAVLRTRTVSYSSREVDHSIASITFRSNGLSTNFSSPPFPALRMTVPEIQYKHEFQFFYDMCDKRVPREKSPPTQGVPTVLHYPTSLLEFSSAGTSSPMIRRFFRPDSSSL